MAKEIFDANTYQIHIVNDTLAKTWLQYNPLFDKHGNYKSTGRYWPLAKTDLSDAIQQGIKELQVNDQVNRKTYTRSILDILKQHATVLEEKTPEPVKEELVEVIPAKTEEVETLEPEQEEAPAVSEQLIELGEAEEVVMETTESQTMASYDGDLTRVKGIGAKTAALLADNGIPSLQELAQEAAPYITSILTANNRKFKADPKDWIDQAKAILNDE